MLHNREQPPVPITCNYVTGLHKTGFINLILLDSEEHIMISYHWDCQKTMLKLKTELESKGLRVWMDVEKMKGVTPETMARAVEKSSIVLIAMSRKYQSSPVCRSGSFIGNCNAMILIS